VTRVRRLTAAATGKGVAAGVSRRNAPVGALSAA